MPHPPYDDEPTLHMVQRATSGDEQAWEALVGIHRGRLRRMVELRLDRRLQGRLDASDVVQESLVDAARRLRQYAERPTMPFFLWLRFLTGQRLAEQHRRHLGAKARNAAREVSLEGGYVPSATTARMALQLVCDQTTPSEAIERGERQQQLQQALDALDPIDREVLAMRHFEQLTNGEVAAALGIDKSAASKRYLRALGRLKDIVATFPDSH
ncbi:MAG: sigma-70 family RNA polymerase sigma factor [Planctomycetales bacterium]|nr:sigma-70 family RNA polymerase sigma factor [Planctomycetales bacterium]